MLHPSAYLAYAAWLLPLALPFLFAFLWRRRLQRKVAFVFIGALCAFGVVFVSMFFLGFLLGWLNNLLSMSLRGPTYGGVPALVWFNGIFMLAFNLAVSVIALVALSRLFAGSSVPAVSRRVHR